MAQTQFHQPDEEAMERLLWEYRYVPTGIILLLAWREGLTRAEISDLVWDEVDFDAMLLRLPDREVPLEPDVAEILRRWKNRCAGFSEYVAVSDRLRKRLSPPSISVMVRKALDREGQDSVRLQDLRHDYVRRQLAAHDWPYVLRVAGISLTTYRDGLYRLAADAPAPEPKPQDDVGEDFQFWRVLQTERGTPAGIALWLSSQMGLQCEEIVRLTWDDVDLDGQTLRLPDRTVPLTVGAANVLREEKARRRPGDDPHVILTPQSRKPMEAARLTTVARAALIRGGIEDRTMQDFRRDIAWEAQREKLRAWVAEHGSITRMEASELLDLSMGQTYYRLTKLTDGGELVLLRDRYWPAEAVVAPADREDAILRYIAEHGPVYRREVQAMLRVCRVKATEILNRMIAEGKLERKPGTWQYAAAKSYKATDGGQTDNKVQIEMEPIIAVKSQMTGNT